MHLSQLQIFSKKRDAAAILKGYEFQHLKTLKTWLENRVNDVDEWIYCDFEEDIFQRDLAKEKIRLRQIKLYSTDFSFSSDAIQETIAHFFMLYVKGEYMFDTITFSFETNATVVGRDMRGNDADLLRELAGGWTNITEERKAQARERVRGILGDYIGREYAARSRDGHPDPALQEAKGVFDTLSNEVLDHFIGSIQWQFDGKAVNDAVEQLREEISGLIELLPIPGIGPVGVAFSILYREVVTRAMADDPEDRRLLSRDIDLILLRSGDEKAQWYGELYESWSAVTAIPQFYSGQFYEVVDASRYYRMNLYDAWHRGDWMRLFQLYIDNPAVLARYKRKAIYEYLFLSLNPNPLSGKELGSFTGEEDKIRYYYEFRPSAGRMDDVQEDITLFKLVSSQALVGNIDIDAETINKWGVEILSSIEIRLAKELRVDDRCRLLELKGDFQLNRSLLRPEKDVREAIETFQQILPLLKDTQNYTITFLVEVLEGYIKTLVQLQQDQAIIDHIEEFLGEAREAAMKSKSRHDLAHGFVERGMKYLEAGGTENFLQALHSFHRARSLWAIDRTWEGYILSLLNLSQVYSALGMNIAAKYYAYSAIWATWHYGDESMYARLAQATGLLFTANFRQGAWISAIDDYEMFIKARQDFTPEGWGHGDELFTGTVPDMAFLIFAGKQFLPGMGVYFDFRTSHWGELRTGFVGPMVENMGKLVDEGRDILEVARRHLTDEPLSDVGPVRTIAFNALEIQWIIEFENTFLMNAIGEEFTSMLQVFLCEIARLNKGLLKGGISVRIRVVQSDAYDRIKKHVHADEWLAPIPEFRGKEKQEIRIHCARISIMIREVLLEYSQVSKDEFGAFWMRLFEKEMIGEKVSGVNPYQKVYYNAVDKDIFDGSRRAAFTPLPPHTVFQQPKKYLV